MFEKTNKQKTPCHECFVWISAIFAACLKGYQSSPRLQLRGDHPQLCLKRGWMCLFVGLLEIMLPLLLLLAALRDVNLKPFAVDEGC